MTSASAAARREWWPAFAHQAWKMLLVAYISCVAQTFLAPAAFLWAVANVAAMIALIITESRHDRRLCERCIADWPLNPEESVRRARRRLRAFHWLVERLPRRHQYALMAAIAVPYMAAGIWLSDFGFAVFSAGLYSLIGMGAVVNRAHWKLQPWCPQCRGGGGDTFSPDPVTPPSVRADR